MGCINKYIISIGIILLVPLLVGCENNTPAMVLNNIPRVSIIYDTDEPVAKMEINFSANSIPGSSEIISWSWSFDEQNGSLKSGKNVTHTFKESGTYNVELSVEDVNGNTKTIDKSIEVKEEVFPASIVWSYTTGNSIPNPNDGSSPAVVGDGTIVYIEGWASTEASVFGVHDQGSTASLKWNHLVGNSMRGGPSIGKDGNVYITSYQDDNAMRKINSENGDLMWNYNVVESSRGTVATDKDGNSYFSTAQRSGSSRAGVFSLTPSGDLRWSLTSQQESLGWLYTSPAISNDGKTIYVINTGGDLYAINTSDGSLKWPVSTEVGADASTISIGEDGTIYIVTEENVSAINDDGKYGSVKWSSNINGTALSGVVIGPNGDLYSGTEAGLISVNAQNGNINWTYAEISVKGSVPAVDSNGNIYIGSVNGEFSIVSPSGELLKQFSLGTDLVTSPVITDDGTVYVSAKHDDNIKLYKIAVNNSNGPANSNWPMKCQNVRHTCHP